MRQMTVVFNLEGSPLLGSEEDIPHQIMPFRFEELLAFFERYGKDKFIVALANNHILDNGFKGFDHLVKNLEDHHIRFFWNKHNAIFRDQ